MSDIITLPEDYKPHFERTPPGYVNCPRCGGGGQRLEQVGWGTWYDCGKCNHTGFIPATRENLAPIRETLSKRHEYALDEARRRFKQEVVNCNSKYDSYVVDLNNAENSYDAPEEPK
jgi:hypothetical protein